MNKILTYTLRGVKGIYSRLFPGKRITMENCERDPNVASQLIYEKLVSDDSSMIARFGSTELIVLVNYLGIINGEKNIIKYIKGKGLPWWWEEQRMHQLYNWSGFFPPTQEKIEKFCELMMDDMKLVDVLGSWVSNESYFTYNMSAQRVHLQLLEPFWSLDPWTKALEGKKVLVIHPFTETIEYQYHNKRELLFKNKDVLPEFKSLSLIKAVQTLGQSSTEFVDWFKALDSMKSQIDQTDFDVCLVGAGAYGFPLAAHVKRQGKDAVHLGGALQLLFGIKGKRWEDPNYGVKEWGIPYASYSNLMNEHWIRPMITEKPKTADAVEGACYW